VDNAGLEHAMQNDTFSCGIVTANTIAHGALRDELWKLKKCSSARAMWFITLAKEYLNNISTNSTNLQECGVLM
jgi:hypothetical protein